MRSKTIVWVVILFEVLCMAYISPQKGVPKQDLIGNELSKICLNATDLFQAYERADFLLEKGGLFSAVLNVMFYADIKPRAHKEYTVYFEPLPEDMNAFSLLNPGGKIKIYVKDLNSFEEWRRTVNDLEEFYDNLDSCYDIGRNGYRP